MPKRLCQWRLPPDSKIGELQCVRVRGHDGPHWIYIATNKSLNVYRVYDRARGLRLVMQARLNGPVTRAQVAELVAVSQVALTDD
jgi:hypothetical protein